MQKETISLVESKQGKPKAEDYHFSFSDVDIWRNYLEENGFVVIRDFLPEKALTRIKELLWDMIAVLTDRSLRSDDPETWRKPENDFPAMWGGMVQYMGHSNFQWESRKEAARIFSALYNCKEEELLTSFDGFCFMNGHKKTPKEPIDKLLHTDQSAKREGFWSYQGLLNIYDNDGESGGFVCVPGSQKKHKEYFSKYHKVDDSDRIKDYFMFSAEEKARPELQGAKKINCFQGDFILFDSRLFHCNTRPTKKVFRACAYVCMLPKTKVSSDVIKRRRALFEEGRVCSHHPIDFKVFPEVPRFGRNNEELKKKIQYIQGLFKPDGLCESLIGEV